MSCHDIGRAAAYIIEEIIEDYDNGKISLEVANNLIKRCVNSVNYCDGNEYEAYEDIKYTRCGRCLTKTNDLNYLLDDDSFTDLSWKDRRKVLDDNTDGLLLDTPYLCDNCYSLIKGKYFNFKSLKK